MARYHFGGGCPDPGSCPLAGLAAAAERALPRLREALCNYPERQGYRPLREVAAARFQRREGVALDPDTFCLTNGSQQAITLVCQALVRRGDPVLVEEFLYSGTLRALRHVGARVVGIPMDAEGMRMDALEAALHELTAAGWPAAWTGFWRIGSTVGPPCSPPRSSRSTCGSTWPGTWPKSGKSGAASATPSARRSTGTWETSAPGTGPRAAISSGCACPTHAIWLNWTPWPPRRGSTMAPAAPSPRVTSPV